VEVLGGESGAAANIRQSCGRVDAEGMKRQGRCSGEDEEGPVEKEMKDKNNDTWGPLINAIASLEIGSLLTLSTANVDNIIESYYLHC
jgi:hypothetical protein